LAYEKALALAKRWLREEERHRRMTLKFGQSPHRPSLPIWTGMPEIEEQAREEYLATPARR